MDEVLQVDTHAEPLNYVATPLSHDKTEIIRVYGDKDIVDYPDDPAPQPFTLEGEIPSPK